MGLRNIFSKLENEIGGVVSRIEHSVCRDGLGYYGIPFRLDMNGNEIVDINALRIKRNRMILGAGARAMQRAEKMATFTIVDTNKRGHETSLSELITYTGSEKDKELFEYVTPRSRIDGIKNVLNKGIKTTLISTAAFGMIAGAIHLVPQEVQESIADQTEKAFLESELVPTAIKNDVVSDRLSIDDNIITIDGTITGSLVKDLKGKTTYGIPLLAYTVDDDGITKGIAFSDRSGYNMETLQSLMSSIRDGNEIKVKASRLYADGESAKYNGIQIYVVDEIEWIRNPLPEWEQHDEMAELENLIKLERLLQIPEPEKEKVASKHASRSQNERTSVQNVQQKTSEYSTNSNPQKLLFALPIFHEGVDENGYYLLGEEWNKFYFDPEKWSLSDISQIRDLLRAGDFITGYVEPRADNEIVIKEVDEFISHLDAYTRGWTFESRFLKPSYFGESVEKEFTVLCHDYDASTQTHLTAFATDQLDSEGKTMVLSGMHLMGFNDSQIRALFDDVSHGDRIKAKVRLLKLYDGGVPEGYSMWAIEEYKGVTFRNPLGIDHDEGVCASQYQNAMGE